MRSQRLPARQAGIFASTGIAAIALLLLVASSCATNEKAKNETKVTPAQVASNTAPEALPPLPSEDGKVLYAFLSEQIPQVISQVPCTCCGKTLDWCYAGGCPFA